MKLTMVQGRILPYMGSISASVEFDETDQTFELSAPADGSGHLYKWTVGGYAPVDEDALPDWVERPSEFQDDEPEE